MPRAYFSTVLDYAAGQIWATIRPFDHYAWAGVQGETIIEDGRRGDQVGSIRRFASGAGPVRQILLAHSDIDRSYSYAFVGDLPVPARNYVATIRVTPVVDGGRSFVEWWATFECSTEDGGRLVDRFENEGFAIWLGALRSFMDDRLTHDAVI